MRLYITRQDRLTIQSLTSAPIPPRTDRTRIGIGITNSTYGYFGDVKAIVKSSGASLEVAAYDLSTVFPGLVHVPPTILRESLTDYGKVSIQAWVSDSHPLQSYASATRSDMIGLATFDWIIGNADRHRGNFLQRGSTLYPIDHGYAFDTQLLDWRGPIGHVAGMRIPAYIHSHIRTRLLANEADVRALLAPNVSARRIDAVFDRARRLTAFNHFPGRR